MLSFGDAALEQQLLRDALDRGVEQAYVLGWRYASPAVVLGRGQPASVELLARAERERLEVVSRASGGGAVMAGPWMFSITLLLPIAHALATASLPAGYRAVGECCRRALQHSGVPATLATTPAIPDDVVRWACFAGLSHGELAAPGGGKVLGIAQVRRRDAIAVCIGVLLGRPDWEALVRVWCGRDDPVLVGKLESRTANCEQFVPAHGAEFVESLATALEAEFASPRLAA